MDNTMPMQGKTDWRSTIAVQCGDRPLAWPIRLRALLVTLRGRFTRTETRFVALPRTRIS